MSSPKTIKALVSDDAPERNGSLFDPTRVASAGIWDPNDLERTNRCLYCGKSDCSEVAARKDGLVIRECANCGLAFVDPRPSPNQLARYYREGYFEGARDFFHGKDYCLERDRSIRAGGVTGYREIVSNFDVAGKRILDVGCASGALLCMLRERGAAEVVGLDTSAYPVSFGVERYGLDLRCASLEDARLPDGHFDLITLIDIVEHVEDIISFMRELRRVLRPDGKLFIITPNYSAHTVAADEWVCLHQDFEHLQYFSSESLSRLAQESGFSTLKTWTDSLPFKTHPYPSLRSLRLHQLFHPGIAVSNAQVKARYKRVAKVNAAAGLNLNAIIGS